MFEIPSLPELIDRTEKDFSGKFFGRSALLRRSVLRVLSRVWAGLVYLNHLFLAWIYRNSFVHKCDPGEVARHGIPVGIFSGEPVASEGLIVFSGTVGTAIPAGTVVKTSDGIEFITLENAIIGSDEFATVRAGASEPGSSGNIPEELELQIESAISGIDPDPVVGAGGMTGGIDAEDPETLRRRILFKKQNPPQGSADSDYVIWATSVSGCTDAFILPQYPQSNSVQIVISDYGKWPAAPVCDAAILGRVEAVISRYRPVTAAPVVRDIRALPVDIRIRVFPATPEIITGIRKELESLLFFGGRPLSRMRREMLLAASARAAGVEALDLLQADYWIDGSPVFLDDITVPFDACLIAGNIAVTQLI